MKAFLRTIFFSIILGAFMAIPVSYFFIKDFVQPRVQETIGRIDELNTSIQRHNEVLEQILSLMNQIN
jgi:hypothetical protein